jgi:hypothetical protein
MRSFLQHIQENSTANMIYLSGGAGFAIDRVASDFDVEDVPDSTKKKMKPWEVENADLANQRREFILKWMRSVSSNKEEAVNSKSLPQTPAWQSRTR